jgi:predicted SnoaL-like aldol condensation-catalyzing enzyme
MKCDVPNGARASRKGVSMSALTFRFALSFPATAAALLTAAVSISACASSPRKDDSMTTPPSAKQQVRELLSSIETGDPAPIAYINADNYRQHNLAAADGLAGFAELLQQLPPGSAKARPARVFQDGDFVFSHTEYDFFGPKIGFDVFRFENGKDGGKDGGKIVEHWDNLQTKPAQPNPSGRTMIDGATEATDLDRTEDNKQLVRTFVEDVLMNGRMDRLPAFFAGDAYLQHNPQVADGLSGLAAALKAMAEQGITMKYDRVHRVLGEGNFVLVMSEGNFAGKHVGFYDLFRVADGKIAEHWDTIEEIPPREQWKNDNGKF